MATNELIHYGVRGMKWGVRRYQNKDGSLTAAGRKRYSDGGDIKKAPAKAKTSKGKVSSSKAPKKKTIADMSDDELNRAVRRFQLEQQYRNLNPQKVSTGKRFAQRVMKNVVVPAVENAARNALQNAVQDALNNALKTKDRDKNK